MAFNTIKKIKLQEFDKTRIAAEISSDFNPYTYVSNGLIEAIDKLDPYHRTTPTNRELLAQGAGNMLCGFLGALPMTAVIVRGSANIDAGGRTRWASFTHGIFLIAAVVLVPFLINSSTGFTAYTGV